MVSREVARALRTRLRRAAPVVGEGDGDPVADQVEAPPGCSLAVEADADGSRVGGVAPEVHRGVELCLAQVDEGLTLGVGLAVEPGPGQEVEDGSDAGGLQHDFVGPGLQLDGVGGGAGLLRRRRSRPPAVEVLQGAARLGAQAVRGSRTRHPVELGHGRAARDAQPGRVGQAHREGVG